MSEEYFKVDALYRSVKGEMVAIQLETGKLYYFSSNSFSFFDFFREPSSLSEFMAVAAVGRLRAREEAYLKEFIHSLWEKKLLTKMAQPGKKSRMRLCYSRPVFVRESEKTQGDIFRFCRLPPVF